MHIFPASLSNLDVPIPANDPRSNGHQSRYSGLMQAIRDAKGEWVCCADPSLIAGKSLHQKSVALYSASARRELRIKTTIQNGLLYVKLLDVPSASNAVA